MKIIYFDTTERYLKFHTDNEYKYYIWLNSDDFECYRFMRIPKDTQTYRILTDDEVIDLGGEFSNSKFFYKE